MIVGISDQRELFQDNDEKVAQKVEEAQKQGLNVILCVGETAEQRDTGNGWQSIEKLLLMLNGSGGLRSVHRQEDGLEEGGHRL